MPLGLEDGRFSNPLKRASTYLSSTYAPWRARLNLNYGWIAARNNRNQWLQLDSLAKTKFTKVATQGRKNGRGNWVKSYAVRYSHKGYSWQTYKENGRKKVKSSRFTHFSCLFTVIQKVFLYL